MNFSESENSERRAFAYKLLADCLKSPDESIFEMVDHLTGILDEIGLETGSSEISEDLESLMVDHARLFVGPSTPVASPYGSMYLGNENKLMSESTIKALKWYESEGMEVAVKDIPDHIRIELEFMYYLAFKESQASDGEAEIWQDKQKRFLGQHLVKWISSFEQQVNDGADTLFYKKIARLTRDFVLHDFNTLKDLSKKSTG